MRLVLAAALSVFLLAACKENLSVEQHIIANLRAMEEAAEQGEHFEFMAYVSESFSGQYASMDRRAFHRFMIFQLNQKRRLHAQFFPIRVQEVSEQQTLKIRIFRLCCAVFASENPHDSGGPDVVPSGAHPSKIRRAWFFS